MKTLICKEPGKLEYIQRPEPQRLAGQTVLRIRRIGVCGTDLHAYEGTQPYFSYPRVLGHELSAEVAEPEPGSVWKAGDRVTIIPYFHCGTCVACRQGKTNCCAHINVCGVHSDGGMAEYLAVPTAALVEGATLSFDELALVEPLAIGAHGVRRAAVARDEFVLVIGAGPIGLGTIEFAVLAGARVIVADVSDERLRFCRQKMPNVHTINPLAVGMTEALQELTHGDMPAIVIDATGNLQAIEKGFSWMAHGGRYVLIGLQKGEINFSHPEFHKREGSLMSSRNATRQDFEKVMSAIQSGSVQPAAYITHRVSFDLAQTEFPGWIKPEAGVIKAMISLP